MRQKGAYGRLSTTFSRLLFSFCVLRASREYALLPVALRHVEPEFSMRLSHRAKCTSTASRNNLA